MNIWSLTAEDRADKVCIALAERLKQDWTLPPWFCNRALKAVRRWVLRQSPANVEFVYGERSLFGFGPMRWAVVELKLPQEDPTK